MSDDYAALQETFATKVIANQLRLDQLWASPCNAYNLHARLDETCRRRLSAVQDELTGLDERGLLRCPPGSRHVRLGRSSP